MKKIIYTLLVNAILVLAPPAESKAKKNQQLPVAPPPPSALELASKQFGNQQLGPAMVPKQDHKALLNDIQKEIYGASTLDELDVTFRKAMSLDLSRMDLEAIYFARTFKISDAQLTPLTSQAGAESQFNNLQQGILSTISNPLPRPDTIKGLLVAFGSAPLIASSKLINTLNNQIIKAYQDAFASVSRIEDVNSVPYDLMRETGIGLNTLNAIEKARENRIAEIQRVKVDREEQYKIDKYLKRVENAKTETQLQQILSDAQKEINKDGINLILSKIMAKKKVALGTTLTKKQKGLLNPYQTAIDDLIQLLPKTDNLPLAVHERIRQGVINLAEMI